MKSVNIGEAKARLSEFIDAALRGEEIVIARRHVPLVRLTAMKSAKPKPQFGRLAGRLEMRDDFEQPLEDLDPYR